MSQKITLEPATQKESRLRLDKFLTSRLEDTSRERIKALISEGFVTTQNGDVCTKTNGKVTEGSVFIVSIPEPTSLEIEPENIPLDILYEDEELLVLNKSADITMHPSGHIVSGTLVNALLHHCKGSLSGIGGVERPGIVHRLDKGTSGVVVIAKTDVAHQHLGEQFHDRTMERTYIALCYGTPTPRSGEIHTQIGRHPKDRKKQAIVEKGGKEAKTAYQVLETFLEGEISLVEFRLQTGRTHQIRVHATHIGHPLLGDQTYGRPKKVSDKEVSTQIENLTHQMLHAKTLGFTHPKTGEFMRFESEPPEDMANLLNSLHQAD